MVISKEIETYWHLIAPFFTIRNVVEYEHAIERLNSLLDEIGTDEDHPLYGLLDTLGTVIREYEATHYPMPTSTGADILHFFMAEHQLTQSDLPEIGSQGVVSEILNGKRELNIRQVRALAERFHVSPAVFV